MARTASWCTAFLLCQEGTLQVPCINKTANILAVPCVSAAGRETYDCAVPGTKKVPIKTPLSDAVSES